MRGKGTERFVNVAAGLTTRGGIPIDYLAILGSKIQPIDILEQSRNRRPMDIFWGTKIKLWI